MNQEITLERCGDAIHLIYRHYRGSFYGNVLGNRLKLTGVEPPTNGNGNGNGHVAKGGNGHAVKGLAPGQYYQVQTAGDDGEMHALLAESQLADVQQAVVHDLHIPVAAGAELFPPDVPPALEEEERRSAGQIVGLIVGGLFVLAVLGAAGFVVWESVGHEDLTMAAFITRVEAAPPAPAASGLGNAIGQWAAAANVRIPLANVLFLTETKLVLADGAFVAIEGAGDLRGLAPLAEKEAAVPTLEARLGPTLADVVSGSDPATGRGLPLRRIRCGGTTFAETGILKPIAILTPSTTKPARGATARDEGFRIVTDLRFDERRTFAPLVQSRISLRGRIVAEESGRVLRLANGTGVALASLPDGSRVEPFLAGIAGDKTEVQVDLVFERAFPWKNAKHPAESREGTRIAGVGRVLSVSAEGLSLTDER
jgi:hypothetical protein